MKLDWPSPTEQPATYKILAEVNGFLPRTSSTASDDDDARSTASGYSDAVSVAARRASAADADQGAGTTPVLKFTGSSLENLRESLNLSNDTNDAISILPDGQLRLEFANPDGGEGSDDPP